MIYLLSMLLIGILVGIGAAFSGLGGGFLLVPILLYMGFDPQRAVGTSFLCILIISISALIAHSKLDNVDYRSGILIGIGGIVGAQIGSHLTEHVSTATFKLILALILIGLATYILLKK